MDLKLLLLFLHIAVMFAAVTASFGLTTGLRIAFSTNQVAAVRGVGMVAGRVAPLIPAMFVTAGILGLLTAIVYGYNLLAPWLLIAYLGFGIFFVLGIVENKPFGDKLAVLLKDQPPFGPIEGELRALFSNSRVVYLTSFEYLLLIVLIFDMVVKPFSS